MLSVTEARERILNHFNATAEEEISFRDCAGRVLAQDILAQQEQPPFDNSSMDGFAVRAADTQGKAGEGVQLKVIADIPAGYVSRVRVGTGEAARIMTGSKVPEGADAVVAVENTDFHSRLAGSAMPAFIMIQKQAREGENIRRRGEDVQAGDVILKKGRRLKAQDVGMLAMLGVSRVPVHKKPRVVLFSSGDELLGVDEPLREGKIHDSNSHMLAALIAEAGAEVLALGIAKDTRESVEGLLQDAVQQGADLILSSAGVSVGAFDFVKDVLESNGSLNFWRVNMRPGKPLAFGEYGGTAFIGLPGNPVSAFVGFTVFVRPALERLGGQAEGERARGGKVRCGEMIESDGRESYLRAMVRMENGEEIATLAGQHQGSGNLMTLVLADALLIIPAGVKCVPAGQEIEIIRL